VGRRQVKGVLGHHGGLLQQWIGKRTVRVRCRARQGRAAKIPLPNPNTVAGPRRMTPIHLDDHLIAADKPAGELAVPGRKEPRCLTTRVQALWPDAQVVHRLDQATSGLMLFARGAAVQRTLSIAFAQRQVDKQYIAWVHGLPAQDHGCIELPLAADWPNRPRQQVDMLGGKPALTHWRVLGRDVAGDRTRLGLQPLTGRTHQLRVHLAAIGHAIVGDALYGPADGAARLMLHATRLALAHPVSGAALVLDSPAPF